MNDNANRRQTLRDEELDPALSEVSRTVIGCAIEIHKELGPGFDRSVYENALAADLKAKGVEHRLRPDIEVLYNDQEVGTFSVSLEVDDRFVVEILSDPNDVGGIERDALRAKIKNAELDMGLIVNFARRRLRDGLVRVLNPERIDELRGMASDDDHDDEDDQDAQD